MTARGRARGRTGRRARPATARARERRTGRRPSASELQGLSERLWFPCDGVCPLEREGKPTACLPCSQSRDWKFDDRGSADVDASPRPHPSCALTAGVRGAAHRASLPVGGRARRGRGRRSATRSASPPGLIRGSAARSSGGSTRSRRPGSRSRSPSSWSPSPASCSDCSPTSCGRTRAWPRSTTASRNGGTARPRRSRPTC